MESAEGQPKTAPAEATGKLYILTLKFRNMQKQVFLDGQPGPEGEEKYRAALRGLDEVGDRCSSWQEFFTSATDHFSRSGFVRVPK